MWKSIKAQFAAVGGNKKILVPVLAVLFIPVLYSGMFLWAFWDPYDKMEDLPVAIVNEDKGAEYNDKNLEIGDDLVDKLKDNPQFDWKFVNAQEAEKGMEQNKYYMTIHIPEHFSEKATTVLSDDPEKLDITYTPNASFNFLAAQIGGTAVDRIKESLANELTKTYSKSMFENVDTLGSGLEKAAEGADKLHDGIKQAEDGTGKLLSGMKEKSPSLQKLEDGSVSLAKGTNDLNSGLSQLLDGHNKIVNGQQQAADGAAQLTAGLKKSAAGAESINTNSQKLADGSAKLAEGAGTLSAKTAEWKKGADTVAQGSKGIENGLSQLIANSDKMTDEQMKQQLQKLYGASQQVNGGFSQLTDGASQISGGAEQISTNSQTISAGQAKLAEGAGALSAGQQQLVQGAEKLSKAEQQLAAGTQTFHEKLGEAQAGSSKLAEGMNDLQGGTASLNSGWTEVTGYVQKIQDGQVKLDEGSQELAGKLGEAAEKTGEVKGKESTYDMFASPVDVKTENESDVPNYGTGFAPYFLSLGLFVGALLLSIVFPLRDPAGSPKSAFSWFGSKVVFLGAVGIVQALIADAILLFGLGIEPASTVKFVLFSILTSFTYLALIQFFVTVMGDPGRFVAIIILILQLTTSAGTFPLELIPNALQPISFVLPMTFTVAGFKAAISSGDYSYLWDNSLILIGFTVMFLIGTYLYFAWQFKKSKNTEAAV
ncbi:YhgE/Pip family protein [Fictibacillus iocasae]|uniref:YhgE/Pip family protein n=1 Tax=Fictibacillus iocasae TaxID=2715437 RepID=A0ABW2NJV0_9BACL